MKQLETLINIYNTTENKLDSNEVLSNIVTECEGTIKYFTMKYSNIPMDAEDLRSEILQVIYKTVESYDASMGYEYKTYLSRSVETRCNHLYRDLTRQKRAKKNEDGEVIHELSYEALLEDGVTVTEIESSYNEYSDVEIKMVLNSIGLTKEERLICEKFAGGLKSKEVGDSMGISPAMITYKVKKIRYKMQLAL